MLLLFLPSSSHRLSPPSFVPQLITNALHNIIVHGSEFGSVDCGRTLVDWIAAVHVAYYSIFEEVKLPTTQTSERRSEKRAPIKHGQRYTRERQTVNKDQSAQDELQITEQFVKVAEEGTQKVEERVQQTEQQGWEMRQWVQQVEVKEDELQRRLDNERLAAQREEWEWMLLQADRRAQEAEERLHTAEERVKQEKQIVWQAEERAKEAIKSVERVTEEVQRAEEKVQQAEEWANLAEEREKSKGETLQQKIQLK